MPGFKSFRLVQAILASIELVQMIRKGQYQYLRQNSFYLMVT